MADEKDIIEEQIDWISLGKAADLLGVHAMTLRRWTDSGRFPSYRTPGGHRRFARGDIESYMARHRNELANQVTDTWADAAIMETRQQVSHHREHRWLKAIDEEDLRGEYRQMGHQLMGLLLQYVAAEEPNGSFIEEAQRIGRRYGVYGRRAGLSLSSILEATLFFRDILLESSLQIPATTYVEPDKSLRILRRVNQIINAIQLAVTEFYENGGYRGDEPASTV